VEDAPPWENAEDKDWEDLRMAVYAAQIDRMDQGIGRVMDAIKRRGLDDNTLVMFLADNGGCAELLQEDAGAARPSVYSQPTVDGLPMRLGNDHSIMPGSADTFMSYDIPWANASNAPFRLFKHWVHEGGISTPFIVSWPARIQSSGIVHSPAHFIDISATCLDAAGARYPTERNGMNITPAEGESLLSAFEGRTWERTQPIVWEHEGNRAVRDGQWKLVSEYGKGWELYDMEADRTELNDLAGSEATRVAAMEKVYLECAERCGVQEFPVGPAPAPRQSPNVHVSRLATQSP
jgi:arylsulfatase